MIQQIKASARYQSRILNLFLFAFFLFILPSFFLIRIALIKEFRCQELDILEFGKEALATTLHQVIREQALLCDDLARSPEALDLVQGKGGAGSRDADFIQKQDLANSVLIYFDKNANPVSGGISKFPFGESLKKLFLSNGRFSGVLTTADRRLWIISLSKIVSSSEPSAGFVFLAHDLRDKISGFLTKRERLTVVLESGPFDENTVSSSLVRAWQDLVFSNKPFMISQIGEGSRATQVLDFLIRDVFGEAASLVRLSYKGHNYQILDRILFSFFFGFVILFVFLFLYLNWQAKKMVFGPVERLRDTLSRFIQSKDLSMRLPLDSKEEIDIGLIRGFNEMFEIVEKIQSKVKRTNEEMSLIYKDLLGQRKFTSEILNTAPSIVLVLSPDSRVKYVNEAIFKIAGYKPEDVIGRNWFEDFLGGSSRADAEKMYGDLLANRPEAKRFEIRMLTKAGGERLILWNNGLLFDKEGNFEAYISIGNDTTEQKQMEQEIARKIRDLERFQKVTMDRERVIIDLKKENKLLKEKMGFLNKDG